MIYATVFLPGRRNREVLASKGELKKNGKLRGYYEANVGLDKDRDGKITKKDLDVRVSQLARNYTFEPPSRVVAENRKIVIKFGETLSEAKKKEDRCVRIAKRKYKAWPSAYASGAVVKCRQGKIWKGIKEEGQDLEEDKKGKLRSKAENALVKGVAALTAITPPPGSMKPAKEKPPITKKHKKDLDEEWSEKYKKSIDCKNPKGFSQRAHCQGRKKRD